MKINKDILKIIEAGTSEGSRYYLPKIQLDRKTYVAVNKVLEALGGKWNKRLKAHIFPETIEEAIDNVILTGEVIDLKKELQFFETPPELAEKLVRMAEIQPGAFCLEPSAGKGNIAEALAKEVDKTQIVCYDICEEFAQILRKKNFRAYHWDFMERSLEPIYERVVMNPPFTKQQDIDHVLHALTFLCKGGILVSVMSAGVMYRTNKKTKEFWDIVYKQKKYEVEELPEDSFKSSGTKVNTVVLKIVKG